ncbi:MAG: membrane protein insertase YidC [candidate division Zixibacteria bacterium]|nr:membrane protein insertase YidC [candidate division Zixibacteria bacterium]
MDKKTIALVVILALIVIFYFPIMQRLGFMKPPAEQPPAEVPTDTVALSQQPPPTSPAVEDTSQIIAPQRLEEAAILAEPMLDTNYVVDTIIVNTNKYSVILTSYGGGPVSMLLNDYTYRKDGPIQMLPEAVSATPEATFAGGTFSTSSIHYGASILPGSYDATREPLDVIYTYRRPEGGEVIKSYRFYPDRYAFDLVFEVRETVAFGFERKYNMMWNTPLGVTEPDLQTDYQAMEAVAMMAGSREKLDDFEDGVLKQDLTGATTWAGVRAKYFAAVIIPKNRDGDAAVARGTKNNVMTADGKVEQRKITAGLEMQFANAPAIADSFTVFVGPLDYTLMSKYDVGLEDMLDIGTTPFVGWIIKPFAIAIIWLLPRLYSVVPNYGLVIILFALLVKIVTLPLSMKSFKSMQAMKTLQPKIEALKEKHKKNPQALNQEMMKLYKAHGVNPISGCLPILPQMPLFFALFSVFRSTILLRDAPFVWFISDLSRGASGFADPYIVLVIIMIVAQFVSQKFTMASTQQNKAFMYIMPLFMGFIFYKFAAGLVLYWTCFSVFSLLDYLVFRRDKNPQIQTAK